MRKLLLTIVVGTTILFASSGEELMKVNGCMECHNVMGQKEAPAFMGTARKNIRWFGVNAKEQMIKSIKDGSKGKYRNFSNTEMPAFNYLSSDDLDKMATWILVQYDKNRRLYPDGRADIQSRGQGRR